MDSLYDEVYVSEQRDAVNHARNDGELVVAIVKVFAENDGVATRQDIFKGIPKHLSAYGLDKKEIANALHESDSGDAKNYFHSAIDYTLTDMKIGEYGDDCVIEIDNSGSFGVWILYNASTKNYADIREVATRKARAKTKTEMRKLAIGNLVSYYKTQSVLVQKQIKEVGRDTIVSYMMENRCSASSAVDRLLA